MDLDLVSSCCQRPPDVSGVHEGWGLCSNCGEMAEFGEDITDMLEGPELHMVVLPSGRTFSTWAIQKLQLRKCGSPVGELWDVLASCNEFTFTCTCASQNEAELTAISLCHFVENAAESLQ